MSWPTKRIPPASRATAAGSGGGGGVKRQDVDPFPGETVGGHVLPHEAGPDDESLKVPVDGLLLLQGRKALHADSRPVIRPPEEAQAWIAMQPGRAGAGLSPEGRVLVAAQAEQGEIVEETDSRHRRAGQGRLLFQTAQVVDVEQIGRQTGELGFQVHHGKGPVEAGSEGRIHPSAGLVEQGVPETAARQALRSFRDIALGSTLETGDFVDPDDVHAALPFAIGRKTGPAAGGRCRTGSHRGG